MIKNPSSCKKNMNYLTRPYVGGTLSPRSFLTAFPFCSSFFHKIEIIVFAGSYLPSTFMTIKKFEASRDILHMLPFHQGRRPSPSGNSSFSFQFTDFFQAPEARSPPVPRASRLPQKSGQQIRSNMAKYPGWNLGNDQSKSPHPKSVITILYLNNPNHRTFLIGFGLVCFLSAFLLRITALLFLQPLGQSTQGTLIELLNPTEAEFPTVTCQKGEVHTPPPNKWEQKICVDHICHSFPPDREKRVFFLPYNPGKTTQNVTVTTHGITENVEWALLSFCDSHSTFLSKALLGNPQCDPVMAFPSTFHLL